MMSECYFWQLVGWFESSQPEKIHSDRVPRGERLTHACKSRDKTYRASRSTMSMSREPSEEVGGTGYGPSAPMPVESATLTLAHASGLR